MASIGPTSRPEASTTPISASCPKKPDLNNINNNDQGGFEAANNRIVVPTGSTSAPQRDAARLGQFQLFAGMRGRLVLNGTSENCSSFGEISATHVSLATAIWLQTMVPLTVGDIIMQNAQALAPIEQQF